MVKAAPLWLFAAALLFGALSCWLLQIQSPAATTLTDLWRNTDSLPLLLVQSYTLPRLFMALIAGGTLAFAALLLQQVMHNPLASDNTLGISAGAQFALFVCAIFAPSWLVHGTALIALIGAGLSLLLVMSLSLRKSAAPLILILAGLVVNLYFGAFSALMMLFYPEESRGLAQWGAGSLVQESWLDSLQLGGFTLFGGLIVLLLLRPLSILSLNEANAKSLGVPVAWLRLAGMLLGAFLIAAVVSKVGMLGFVGLAGATIIRQLGVRTLRWQLLGSFVSGALLLGLTDVALQLLQEYQGISLPTGAVTAILGTPLLLWLMFRALPHQGRLTENSSLPSKPFAKSLYWVLFGLLGIFVIVALLLGQNGTTWQLLIPFDKFSQAILSLRLPRLFTAVSAGILLAVAGVILQRLTLNPMASPELLGVSSGASMGILVLLFSFTQVASLWFWFAGIIGSLLALLALAAINRKNGMLPEKVLLTGISLAALFDSLQRIAIASGDPRANQLIAWTSGSTQNLDPTLALPFLIGALALLALSLLLARWLTLFSLQATVAQALGLNVQRARLWLILFSALLTAVATLMIGPLSFIGLLVPHLSQFLGIHKARQQLLISALLGAMLMLFADFLGRQWLFPYEIPAGLIATLIGGSYFLLMIRRV